MNVQFSKELIFDRIKSGYPFWTLFVQKGYGNRSHVGSYSGDDWEEGDEIAAKCEKSLVRLDSLLQSLPANVSLSIDLKNSKTANGSGIIGPLEFSTTEGTAHTNNALAGYQPAPVAPAGYEPAELVDKRIKLAQDDFERRLLKMQQDWKAEQFEKECAASLAELKRIKDELAESKKAYESNVAKTADVLYLAGSKILQGLLPQFFTGTSPAPTQLTGAPVTSAQPQQQQQDDEKYNLVDNIAETLYNEYSENEIRAFLEEVKKKNKQTALENGISQTSHNTAADAIPYDGE